MYSMSTLSSLACFFLSQLLIFQLVYCHCPKEFKCGTLTLSFPFSKRSEPNCGLILVDCENGIYPLIQIHPGREWIIFDRNNEAMWTIPSFRGEDCTVFNNITLPENNSAISFSTTYPKVTMLKCNTNSSNQSSNDHLFQFNKFSNCEKEHHFNIYYNYSGGAILDPVGNEYPSGCSIIQWPISDRTFDPKYEQQLFHLLDVGIPFSFSLHGSCEDCYLSGDRCSVDPQNYTCSKEKGKMLRLIRGSAISAGGIAIILATIVYLVRRKNLTYCWETKSDDNLSIENFLRNYGSVPKRFKYNEIKRITSSFKNKLGQGGFGSVFKGYLDGNKNLVAVKLLSISNGNGEEFVNEVASISNTSHVNVVKLLGFCFERNKRALVYEYMPNGSLEKFIFGGKSAMDNHLGWPTLFKIAIGIARGLEYLHLFCATRMVHFDIKPHNVLLDQEFCPKISDFGLAKLCSDNRSMFSLSGARGTIGYIAPEVVCKNFGGVSHKSDVYSYGMMILEMVGGRKNSDVGCDDSSQAYFPHWIYAQLERNQEIVLPSIMNGVEKESARKMIIVSLWCIQTDPSQRPTMSRVVEMLEGNLDMLQIPPRPYLFSSANSCVADSSSLQ